jgi:carbamoyl-phosphate synthase large subunit
MSQPRQNQDPPTVPVILIGAGGHAQVLLDLLACTGRRVLFVTDQNPRFHRRKLGDAEVRGFDEIILEYDPAEVLLVNAVGSVGPPRLRRDIYRRFRSEGYAFDTLIHPGSIVSQSARIEMGAQIMAGAIVQTGAWIGENVIVNTRGSVDHECVIAAHVHVGPGVTLSGEVRVGETTHLGTASTVIQGIRIGREAMVAAGAVVVRDVEDDGRVAGVPARPVPSRTRAAPVPEPAEYTVMLSAAGRRVALLRLIRQSVQELGWRPRILATDVTPQSAGVHVGDVARIVRRYSDPGCIDELLGLCREFNVKLLVPTIDPELAFYAEHRPRFEAVGTHVMVSSPETIEICNDKRLTHEWLLRERFPTVRQADARRLADEPDPTWPFPSFVKRRHGSGSVGARAVVDLTDLKLATRDDEYIVQAVAPGAEYTVDAFLDLQGRCRCAVPRLRIETRGGEVSKAMTSRCPPVEDLAKRVAERLPGAAGVINIQIFWEPAEGALNVIEINPRFGGGYPLSHQAGATMARWVIEESAGLPLTATNDRWEDRLMMLRYDEAVFVSRDNLEALRPPSRGE